ncbi:unnamed protein product [Trichogramma brassicae]|uniref:Uncharacterized protein n=1 Tax=Trichogramma brassicae TaxID=86971 RepID=A0A6H5J503_9HYME|nr:unnamed protein product [Trichogramma brassicae]
MLPRFSSLKCLAAGASRFVATRKTTPVSNLLLHTSTAADKGSGCSPCQSQEDGWIPQPGPYKLSCQPPVILKRKKVAVVKFTNEFKIKKNPSKHGPRRTSPHDLTRATSARSYYFYAIIFTDNPRLNCPLARRARTSAHYILFGGGYEDGTHPTEALGLAIDLDRRGIRTDFFAPNCKVPKVYDHQEKKESPENRNCLAESTRMAPVTPIYREDAAFGRGFLVNVDHPQPVLCGFGNLDGSDPYQVMSLAINLGRRGFIPTYYAPNATFGEVVDYITRKPPTQPKRAPPQNSNNAEAQNCNAEAQPTSYLPEKCDAACEKPEPRHFMKESARLTSAPVADLGELEKSVKKFAGLIIPGGRGVIDHLATVAPQKSSEPFEFEGDRRILTRASKTDFTETIDLESDPNQDFAQWVEEWRLFLIKYATDFGARHVNRDMMQVKHFENERVNCYTTPGSLGIHPTCARVFASVANLVEDMEFDLERAGAPGSS